MALTPAELDDHMNWQEAFKEFKEADLNGDSRVSREEFVKMISARQQDLMDLWKKFNELVASKEYGLAFDLLDKENLK